MTSAKNIPIIYLSCVEMMQVRKNCECYLNENFPTNKQMAVIGLTNLLLNKFGATKFKSYDAAEDFYMTRAARYLDFASRIYIRDRAEAIDAVVNVVIGQMRELL